MNIFAYFLLANTISGFALFRRKRFEKIENEENYIENALAELRLANCHEIGKMLRNDLYQNTARKCSIFVNCRNLILEKIENAKTLCRITSDTFYNWNTWTAKLRLIDVGDGSWSPLSLKISVGHPCPKSVTKGSCKGSCHQGVVLYILNLIKPLILKIKFRNTSWIRLMDLKVGLTWILPETYRNQNRNRGKATRQEL